MDASVRTPRKLDGDKAQRILAAMRTSVASRGAAAATFDHVAQEAGVSRGLLHYYFGSKERLLVEVVRRDCDLRMDQLEEGLADADSIDAIIEALVAGLGEFLGGSSGGDSFAALVFEMFSASRHNAEIAREMADLYRTIRSHVAGVLRQKQEEGVMELRDDPEAVASILFAMGDGMALQLLSDPDWDSTAALGAGVAAARHLLGARD